MELVEILNTLQMMFITKQLLVIDHIINSV
jgi:hypothetical protein